MEEKKESGERGERRHVLVVDDEEAARYGIRRALSNMNLDLSEAGSVEAARPFIASKQPDLVLLDVNLPGQSGTDFLKELSEAGDAAPLVIMITAYGSERMAVEAIRTGAYDYLSKPFEVDELRLVVKNALETVGLRRENRSLRDRIEQEGRRRGSLLGDSEAIARVRGIIEKVAETDATVLVRGESGTGKELVARELHERSTHRRRGNFVAVNCAALPSELIESELFGHEKGAFTGAVASKPGLLELAHEGTFFFDEIAEMESAMQAKLLHVLEQKKFRRVGGIQEKQVDVRVIAATNRNLQGEIKRGRFREDL
ncbi:MAG TPA: sigma-54 dependent transcriptional regulator, partial [Pyrinomonadaceae bacterium]